MKWIAARYIRKFHAYCEMQRRAWQKLEPGEGGRADLWMARQEAASAMMRWLKEA